MPTAKNENEVDSVHFFLEEIFKLPASSGVRCFRGEADARWALKPSVMRNLKPEAESKIISELMLESPGDFSRDHSMFQRLIRAQHYGLPTRLLDVSLNPLVALFFACSDVEQSTNDANVLILDFIPERVKFAESDTVSVLCNLARLSDSEREEIASKRNRMNGKPASITSFNEIESVKRLVQFVRVEKPYFLNEVKPADLGRYYFVHSIKNNQRIVAQSGAFVVAGALQYKNTNGAYSFALKKIKILSKHKKDILNQLDLININSRTMFPEIESVSKYIKQKWKK